MGAHWDMIVTGCNEGSFSNQHCDEESVLSTLADNFRLGVEGQAAEMKTTARRGGHVHPRPCTAYVVVASRLPRSDMGSLVQVCLNIRTLDMFFRFAIAKVGSGVPCASVFEHSNS